MSIESLGARLDKMLDRMKGQIITVSLNDGSRKSLAKDEGFRLLADFLNAMRNKDKAWLQSEDGVLLQSIVPGQDPLIDLVQQLIVSFENYERSETND